MELDPDTEHTLYTGDWNFIKGEQDPSSNGEASKLKASIVSQDVIFSPKSLNGIGLQRVATF